MFSALADQQTGSDNVAIKDKLNIYIALAPIVNLQNNPSSELQEASRHWKEVMDIVHDLGVYEIRDPKTEQTLIDICSYRIIQGFCNVIEDWFSKKPPYEDQASWDLLQTLPQSSASVKQLIHYGQIIKTGVFKKFDYGSETENKKHYGSITVPELDLNNIPDELPLAVFAGR